MSDQDELELTGAVGYVQEIPGGWVFEIGNETVMRRIHCIGGRIGTTSLINVITGEEYLEETMNEFVVEISLGDIRLELDSKRFYYAGHTTPRWGEDERILRISLSASVDGMTIPVSVIYQALAGKSFLRKRLVVDRVPGSEWVVEDVTLEHLRFKETMEGAVPRPRYPRNYANGTDNVHSEPDKVSTEKPKERFLFGDTARAVLSYWGYSEGLFFFTESILGEETFSRPHGLVMKQKDCQPLSEGLTTGAAAIGAYAGPPEVGFKRYSEFLVENYCAVKGKDLPVSWSTWLVTLEGDKPLYADYDREFLLGYLELMKDAGFYDILHLDLGWEAGWPMQVDKTKFPKGMQEISQRAHDYGFDMTYWVNPFSSTYWKSELDSGHPEWHTGKVAGKSGAHGMCVMSDYYDYVEKRFVELVTDFNARVIYWDGLDWNIPECENSGHGHSSERELQVKATKRLAELCRKVHEARPNALIVNFSLPFNNHRLCAIDQEQVSDTYSFPTIKSELIQRQQLYQMTYEHPYYAIWGSWYGVNWHDAGENNLKRPLRELIHAEMSMIGNGIAQAGGGFDLKQAPAEFIQFLRKLFAFRERFERYFTVYQHVLGFPTGEDVDGEGHIIDEQGFIILVNPTDQERSVMLPLSEPELELSAGKHYDIYDWSNLEQARPLGTASVDESMEISLAPLEVRYIGIDVPA